MRPIRSEGLGGNYLDGLVPIILGVLAIGVAGVLMLIVGVFRLVNGRSAWAFMLPGLIIVLSLLSLFGAMR